MRKLWILLFVSILVTGGAWKAQAGVRFITDVPQNSFLGRPPKISSSQRQLNHCLSAGYTQTKKSCGDKVAVNPCPYNKQMFKACCDKEYSHSKEYCLKRGLQPSRRSCEGLYACQ